jgi:HprK-related kinase A
VKLGELTLDDVRRRIRREGVCVRVGPFVCRFRTRLPDVAASVHFGYADFTLADDTRFADFHIELRRPRGLRRWVRPQTLFCLDAATPFRPYPRRLAAPLLEWGLNWCVAVHAHQYLMIHAAVLERHGRAVIVPGEPGTGKTTLCAGLVLSGWRLLSDELAMVRPEDGRLVPLPRPMSLKNQSIELIRRFSAGAAIGPLWRGTNKGTVALMRPPAESVARADETALPAWVVFPIFRRGSPAQSRRFPKGSSLMRLADNAFNYSVLGEPGFETLARLVDGCDCYEFRYGDLKEAVARFDALPPPAALQQAEAT